MKEENKTKKQLIKELNKIRQRIAELERSKTKLKRVVNTLLQREEKFKSICEAIKDGVIVTNNKGRVTYCNRATERMFGYSNEEIIGKQSELLFTNHNILKDKPRHAEKNKKTTPDKRTKETIAIKKDGSKFPVEVSLSSFKIKRTLHRIGILRDITTRKNVEKRLIIKKFALLSSINGIAFADLKGKLTFVNDSFLKMWKYNNLEEVIGKPVVKFWKEEEKALEIIKKLFEDGKLVGEMTAIRKDGSLFDARLSANMVRDKSGKNLCMMASFIDITKNKKEEETIKRKLKIEKTISAVSSRFIGLYDIDDAINATLKDIGMLSGASRAYLFLLREDGTTMDNTHEWCAEGVSAEIDNLQNLPTNMFPWWMKKLREKKGIHIKDVSRMPKEAKNEKEILAQQNIKSLLVLPLYCIDELTGFIGFDNIRNTGEWSEEDFLILKTSAEIIGNAIELKRMEKTLQKSEEKYRTLVEKTGDVPYVTDANGVIRYIGPQVEKYGLRVKDIVDRNFIDFIYPDDKENTLLDFQNTIKYGIEVVTHFRINTPQNGLRYFEDTGKILKDDTGEIIGLTGMLRDITELKRAESQLKEQVKEAHFLSILDELTGLYNRRGFFTLAEQQLKLAKRRKKELLFVYIDVDHLKRINDNFGHRVGSLALIEIANILKESFRESDIIARIGGDEFVVLAIETSLNSEKNITSRLQNNLMSHNKQRKKQYNYYLSISVGISRYNPESQDTINDLMNSADKMMYKQKQSKIKERVTSLE